MSLGGSRYPLTRTNKLFMIFGSVRHTGCIRCRNVQPDAHKHAAQQPLSFPRPQPPSDIIASRRLLSFLPTKRVFVTGNTPKFLGQCRCCGGRAQLRTGMRLPRDHICHVSDHGGGEGGWHSSCRLCVHKLVDHRVCSSVNRM